jgi:hypothetical protein
MEGLHGSGSGRELAVLFEQLEGRKLISPLTQFCKIPTGQTGPSLPVLPPYAEHPRHGEILLYSTALCYLDRKKRTTGK